MLTKVDFVRRYQKSEFGNRAPTWDTVEEYLASGYRGLVHIRNRVAGGPTWYNIPEWMVKEVYDDAVPAKYKPSLVYFSGMAPHDKGTIQGEVQQSIRGLDLTYARADLPMREALARETLYASGIKAVGLLRSAMDSASYDWLQYLLEAYPDHVIEFSCFSLNWGTVPNRNTIVWEVRKY